MLPFEPKLYGQAANNGQMISELNSKSKAAEGFSQLARAVARREAAPTSSRKPSPLANLFKRAT